MIKRFLESAWITAAYRLAVVALLVVIAIQQATERSTLESISFSVPDVQDVRVINDKLDVDATISFRDPCLPGQAPLCAMTPGLPVRIVNGSGMEPPLTVHIEP
jgi:hypothetical protein